MLLSKITNLSVRKKIFIVSNIGITTILILCTLFLFGLHRQRMLIDEIFNKRFYIYSSSSEIVRKINVVHTNMYKGFVWALTGYDLKTVEDLLTKQMALLDESRNNIEELLSSGVLTKKEQTLFNSILENHEKYKKRSIYAKESALQGGDITTASIILQMGDDQFWILYEKLNELMKIQNDLSKESQVNSNRSFLNFAYLSVVFIILAVILSILISFTISRSITEPIKKLRNILDYSPSGNIDFNKFDQINSKDEIGLFAHYCKKFLFDIESTTQQLRETRDSLWGEMKLAKKIQTVLLPARPDLKGYDISTFMEPSDEVGGDYYDIISVKNHDWIIIGDVSGHGITSGLVMMMVQTSIHTILDSHPDTPPSELLSIINRTIYNNIQLMDEQKHMTIVVMALGKDGCFNFSGLHEDILIWRKITQKVEVIETNGMWIGIEPDIGDMLSVSNLRVDIGDCMVLFTDGITEARMNGDFFGDDRLVSIIEKYGSLTAIEIHNHILDALSPYTKLDDVTLLVIKRNA